MVRLSLHRITSPSWRIHVDEELQVDRYSILTRPVRRPPSWYQLFAIYTDLDPHGLMTLYKEQVQLYLESGGYCPGYLVLQHTPANWTKFSDEPVIWSRTPLCLYKWPSWTLLRWTVGTLAALHKAQVLQIFIWQTFASQHDQSSTRTLLSMQLLLAQVPWSRASQCFLFSSATAARLWNLFTATTGVYQGLPSKWRWQHTSQGQDIQLLCLLCCILYYDMLHYLLTFKITDIE